MTTLGQAPAQSTTVGSLPLELLSQILDDYITLVPLTEQQPARISLSTVCKLWKSSLDGSYHAKDGATASRLLAELQRREGSTTVRSLGANWTKSDSNHMGRAARALLAREAEEASNSQAAALLELCASTLVALDLGLFEHNASSGVELPGLSGSPVDMRITQALKNCSSLRSCRLQVLNPGRLNLSEGDVLDLLQSWTNLQHLHIADVHVFQHRPLRPPSPGSASTASTVLAPVGPLPALHRLTLSINSLPRFSPIPFNLLLALLASSSSTLRSLHLPRIYSSLDRSLLLDAITPIAPQLTSFECTDVRQEQPSTYLDRLIPLLSAVRELKIGPLGFTQATVFDTLREKLPFLRSLTIDLRDLDLAIPVEAVGAFLDAGGSGQGGRARLEKLVFVMKVETAYVSWSEEEKRVINYRGRRAGVEVVWDKRGEPSARRM